MQRNPGRSSVPAPLILAAVLAVASATSAAEEEGGDGARAGEASREESDLEASLRRLRESLDTEGKEATLRVGGVFIADTVLWDRRNERHSGLEGSAARPSVDFRWRDDLRVHAEADLLGADARGHLLEAWAEWRPDPSLRIRAGRMRFALGTEFATREEDLPLAGYAFTSWLDGRHDAGAAVEGSLGDGALWGQASFASGHGFGLDGRARRSPWVGARVALRPFRGLADRGAWAGRALGGWFVGGGAALLGDFDDPVVLETPLGSTVFRTDDLGGDGGRWLHLDTGFAAGPVAAGLEVVRGSADGVPGRVGAAFDANQLTAWTASTAVSLTGERREWRDGAWKAPVPGSPGGAWEFALRYSNGDIDRDLFHQGFTTYDPSSQEFRTFSTLLGWRPAEGVRVAVGWVKVIADDSLTVFGGPGPRSFPRSGDDDRDSSFVLRLEISF